MPRSVAGRRPEDLTTRPPHPDRKSCNFCIDKTPLGVRHDLCPGEIHTAAGKKDDKLWTCVCWKEGHPSEHRS